MSGATRAVAFDISKAFDRVWHAGLLHKLKSYGISGQINGLFLLFSVIDGFMWFWMGSLHKNIQLMLEFPKPLFLVLHYSYYTLMTLMMLSVILLSILRILLSILSVIRYLYLWQQLKLSSEHESALVQKWLVDFNAGKTQLGSFDRSNNTGIIDVNMDGSILEQKSCFKMLQVTFSSKLDWGFYIMSIGKTASKKS